MVKIYLLFVLMFGLFSCQPSEEITSIYLVRHAEKANDGTKDPPLSDAGFLRAERLAEIMNDVPLDRIYSTAYLRTKMTAEPVANIHSEMILLYDPHDQATFAEVLFSKHRGETILVVGHSNSIPDLVNLLIGEEKFSNLDELEYDKLFVVRTTDPGKGKCEVQTFNPN